VKIRLVSIITKILIIVLALERETREERYQYLQKARDYQMNVQAITVRVVQMILETYKSKVIIITLAIISFM
jgi:hypothetical protein